MEARTYAEFSARVHAEVNQQRIPVNGTIEITHRCPLTCAHCYNNLPMADAGARARELTFEEHCRVIDELADLGCLWVLYTGGEIFARRDFLDIYTHAKKRGLLVTLFTNGTLITESLADYLVKWPPFSIEITLYGATAETYEALTGIPGSYARCMRGIELLAERRLPLKLKTVAVSINRHEIAAMHAIADRYGVEFKFDAMINPRIDCSSSPLAVRLTPAEVVSLDLLDEERVVEWRRMLASFGPIDYGDEQPQVYDCGGGVNSFAIDPYGDMTICVLSKNDRYNVRDGSVYEGWQTFLRAVRDRKATRLTKCTRCALKGLCGMCPANGELENGDPEAPVDFLCQTAHLRARALDVEVPEHGDCEYCESGEQHELMGRMHEELRAIMGGETFQPLPIPPRSAASCTSGGCSSCSLGR